jgi:hypothetical protein
VFEGDAINLMDLVVFQSRLQQHGGGVAAFFTSHRRHAFDSTAPTAR